MLADDGVSNGRVAPRLTYLAGVGLMAFCYFFLLRLIFALFFADVHFDPDRADIRQAMWIGARFDLRLAILLVLPLLMLAYLPRWNLHRSVTARRLAQCYLGLSMLAILYFYIVDIGHYLYLGHRMDSSVLRFLEDPLISANMIWQSYPVVPLLLGLFTGTALFMLWSVYLARRLLQEPGRAVGRARRLAGVSVVVLVLTVGLHGRIWEINLYNPVPLRWNDAFFTDDSAVTALGINPVLFFFDTFEQRELPYDEETVARYFPAVAEYLNVDPDGSRNLDRRVVPDSGRFAAPPNVIFIMLESLGAARLGIYGNPVEPTPTVNLDRLASEGWYFTDFYVPVSGTARTVWAVLTGLPDVLSVKTASRNPAIARQRIILNHYDEYEKFYFIGGAAGWANMSAFIRQSIPDIQLYEEGDWQSPIVDVWGVSDLDLFKETHAILTARQSDKPFFAFIQTAGNHRPFTIPPDNDSFEAREDISEEALEEAGFRSNAQFNAVRLLDYNIGRFMEMAAEGGYFDNTVFVLFGDHNNRITRTPFMSPHYEALDLDGLHVPFIIYSPGSLEPRRIEEAMSLLDVMPTVTGLVGIPYDNTTLGRDLFDPVPEGERAVYVQTADKRYPVIGMVSRGYMLRMNHDLSEAKLHRLGKDSVEDVSALFPERHRALRDLTKGVYEVTRWQMYANRPED